MLVVGFYLLNIGFVLLRLKTNSLIIDLESMIVYLSSSIGFVLVVLGAFHFFNMFLVHKFREAGLKKATQKSQYNELLNQSQTSNTP
jgi:hypothetical protein